MREAPLKITHLVLTLERGGAETTLYNLLNFRQSPDIEHSVINVGAPGSFYEQKVERLAAAYAQVDIRRNSLKACATIRYGFEQADAVVFWLYKGCAIGTSLLGAHALTPQLWCIRHAQLDRRDNSPSTLSAARFCARRSDRAAAILYNGERARDVNEAFGFDPARSEVVRNGCDLTRFRARSDAKPKLADELGLPRDGRIVLATARFHPIKDIPTLIEALAPVMRAHPDASAVLAGTDMDEFNGELAALLRRFRLDPSRVRLVGPRDDVERLYAAADVFVLSSAGEAFPNALIEAMASETVCVSTDAGDVATMLGEADFVVAPRDPAALASKLDQALSLSDDRMRAIGAANRRRVEACYPMGQAVSGYEKLFRREALRAREERGA